MKVVTDPRAGPAPEKATAAPNEDGGGGEKKGKAKKEKGNCRNGMSCTRVGCRFVHPAGHVAARVADEQPDELHSFLIPVTSVQVDGGSGGKLGSGANGEVRSGLYKGEPVALKSIFMLRTDAASEAEMGGALNPDERQELASQFKQECDHMQRCTHKNIVPVFGVVVDDSPRREPLYLAMQLIKTGTLQDVIHRDRYKAMRTYANCIPLAAQLTAINGLFSALEYLAAVPLVHRDIKPANVLAVVEGELELVKVLLADFGLAKQLRQSMTRAMMTQGAGTPLYQAPECRLVPRRVGPMRQCL